MLVVHESPTPLTANEHLFGRSYKKVVRFQRSGLVWGTRGRGFESRRSDQFFKHLAASRAERPSLVVRAVVHACALRSADLIQTQRPQTPFQGEQCD